jgi:hypothetical protein
MLGRHSLNEARFVPNRIQAALIDVRQRNRWLLPPSLLSRSLQHGIGLFANVIAFDESV